MKTEIEKYDPCKAAVEFRKQFDTFEEAWHACHRGDWMLWIAKKIGVDIKTLTLAKGHCVNTVRHLMEDERSVRAVDTAIAFGEGKATRKDLDATYAAAATYASASAYAAAHAAAYAAAYASASAYAASYADADAAYAAAYAAASYSAVYGAADAAAAKKENQKQTADICRRYLTDAVFEKLKK